MAREKTIRIEIVEVMKNWINEASSETLVRVFNSEFEGNLTYNAEEETYEIDTEAAENLGLIEY
jgi:hypothetical protein